MGKQKTIIHLLPELIFRREYSLYTSIITTDMPLVYYPEVILGRQKLLASLRRMEYIRRFNSIGIFDGSEVYVVTSICEFGREIYAYGSTTQEKWILTDGWKIVDTSHELIQKKI